MRRPGVLVRTAFALATLWPALAFAACSGRDIRARFEAEAPEVARELARQAAAMPFGQGRLFRVTKPATEPSYLFGTIHVADPRATAFPAAFQEALKGADVVALELAEVDGLLSSAATEKLGAKLLGYVVARPAERADRILSPAEFGRLADAVSRLGQPRSVLATFKPAILATMLALPACAMSQQADFVDALVARAARSQGTRVVGLETVEEQLATLTSVPPEGQAELLRQALAVLDLQEDVYETTIRRYVAGEIGWLLAWMRSDDVAPGLKMKPPEAFNRALLDDRNLRMRDRAIPLLEKGGAVIAVGAAHLPGERGIARLLEGAGYRVERVD
jgi:uncharacterized protein YbaP (TraB family)